MGHAAVIVVVVAGTEDPARIADGLDILEKSLLALAERTAA
jgi:hypothetical protein